MLLLLAGYFLTKFYLLGLVSDMSLSSIFNKSSNFTCLNYY